MDFEAMGEKARSEFVREAVRDFLSGGRLKAARECRAYYDTDNPEIMGRKKVYAGVEPVEETGEAVTTTVRAVAKENQFASNEKIASSFFRDITDSKVQYIAGEGADVSAANDDEAQADIVKAIVQPLAVQMKRVEQESLTDALVYSMGYTYLHVVNGRIKLHRIPYTEVIPYHDAQDKLVNVLRYYKRGEVEFAEYHTPDKIYYFMKTKDSRQWTQTGEGPQIIVVTAYGDGSAEVKGGKGWPRLPWFEMRANNQGTTSLTNAAKSMIRAYDVTVSDFANNLIDIQDVFINLKDSYGSGMDWGEQLEMLKNFKVGEGVEGVTTFEVPYQARQVLLNMLKASIYEALRGVDVGRVSSGQLTNTAIRALYSDIDLWADQAEWHLEDWVRDIVDTVAEYKGVEMPEYVVTFTRRAIFDEVEKMDALARQKGIISDKTLFENHPLVTDAQRELERVEEQEAGAAYGAEL